MTIPRHHCLLSRAASEVEGVVLIAVVEDRDQAEVGGGEALAAPLRTAHSLACLQPPNPLPQPKHRPQSSPRQRQRQHQKSPSSQ